MATTRSPSSGPTRRRLTIRPTRPYSRCLAPRNAETRSSVANDQPARPQGAGEDEEEDFRAGAALQLEFAEAPRDARSWISPEKGGLPAGSDDDPEEAELGPSEDLPRAPNEWDGGHGLYPRRRPQPAGALGRADPRRPGEGP